MKKTSGQILACLFCLTAAKAAGAAWSAARPALWQPIVDRVYLQETGRIISTDRALTAVAELSGAAYVGDAQGVWRVDADSLIRSPGPKGPVTRLRVIDQSLWAVAANGLWRYDHKVWIRVTEEAVIDLCRHNGRLLAVSAKKVLILDNGKLRIFARAGAADLQGVASYAGAVYVHDGKEIGLLDQGKILTTEVADWGALPAGCEVRDIMTFGSRLCVATNRGLALLRGMTWHQVHGEDGLCCENTLCLAQGFDHDLWIGTRRGAIRNLNGEYQFFSAARWIPDEKVNAIACGEKTVYLATDAGLGIIAYEPFTLAKKAAYYERWLEEWGMKRLGFIHQLFMVDGQWQREVSDNDVGYSSHYLAAKCFEYAVTKDLRARAEAVEMMKSVKWSEEITPIDGFPARSIYAVGEPTIKAMHGSGGLPAEWHITADSVWEWKGDTSSDEIDAHVYETTIFLSLVANDKEREWVVDHLRRVIGHIVDNGFILRDVDGEPTRWARWDPAYLQTPYGYYARGLNGLELFNYLTAALHFTGDEKFAAAKRVHLAQGYLKDILRQKLTFPPSSYTHFDDRLAFYSYYPLIQFETDEELKALWLRSLERSWEVKRIEAAPWFNFIYGSLTGNDCELDRAVAHLREWPLDLRRHSYTNSHRDDLYLPRGYSEYSERVKPLSPRETEPNRWDGDFMRLDGIYGGKVIADPGGWLDAYWMGRYYGMITSPQTDDPSLLTVERRGLQLGAKPYAGPERPKLFHER